MADRLELHEVNGSYPTPAEVDAEMPNFIARCQEMINEHYAANLSNLTPPMVRVEGGRKYIKVATVCGSNGSRSVYCFVRAEDGAILKPATWKAPALNFTRGNIFDQSLPMTPYGVRY